MSAFGRNGFQPHLAQPLLAKTLLESRPRSRSNPRANGAIAGHLQGRSHPPPLIPAQADDDAPLPIPSGRQAGRPLTCRERRRVLYIWLQVAGS